jgi:hypothetical protein
MSLTTCQKLEEIAEVADDLLGDGFLTEWEHEFVTSNVERVEEFGGSATFSEKQEEIIDRIYAKVCEAPY